MVLGLLTSIQGCGGGEAEAPDGVANDDTAPTVTDQGDTDDDDSDSSPADVAVTGEICGRLDTTPIESLVGYEVGLEVASENEQSVICQHRAEQETVILSFRAEESMWETIPADNGAQIPHDQLDAYRADLQIGNTMIVRLDRPWFVIVTLFVDGTDEELGGILDALADATS